MRRYISRQKLLHKIKRYVSSHMMDELTVVKYQVDETQSLIEYTIPYLRQQYDDYTFSIIVTMNWTKFLYEFYSNSHFLYTLLRFI